MQYHTYHWFCSRWKVWKSVLWSENSIFLLAGTLIPFRRFSSFATRWLSGYSTFPYGKSYLFSCQTTSSKWYWAMFQQIQIHAVWLLLQLSIRVSFEHFRTVPRLIMLSFLRVQVSSNRKFISATLIQGTVVWRCKARCWAYDIEDNERQLTELEYAMLLQMLSN